MGEWAPAMEQAMSEPDLRKLELEFVRLETDCMQLAGAVDNPSLKLHFLRMARNWAALAASGLERGHRRLDLH
jgi:hypothetical protein